MMYPIIVMKYLKEMRQRASMSQAELGDLVGVRYQLVSAWERGVHTPRGSNIRKICKALNCTREELELGFLNPINWSCLPDIDEQIDRESEVTYISKSDATKDSLIQKLDATVQEQAELIEKLTDLLEKHGLDHYINRL